MIEDEDLRSRLRRADPAASLAPAAPDEVSRLLEQTMTTTAAPRVSTGRQRQFAVLVAAALVLLAAAGVGWLVTRSTPAAIHGKPSALIVSLTADGIQRKCVAPTAQVLANSADFAFAGTVTGIAGDVVTLAVTHVYRGAEADEVRVGQAPGSSEQMLGSGQFEVGKKYLIASSAGGLVTCGYSGEADSLGLREMYEKAF
jgi:hypothetical protein